MSSANPFSRSLRGRLDDPTTRHEADALVEAWDRLEILVIGVYRSGEARPEDQRELEAIQRWMRAHYPRYEPRLRPHWSGVQAAGQPLTRDPLRALWETPGAADLIDSWSSMQLLPAARETLNRWLLSLASRPPD